MSSYGSYLSLIQITGMFQFKTEVLWNYVFVIGVLHTMLIYSFYLIITGQVAVISLICAVLTAIATVFGNLGGAHRLWSHNSYKATWQLRTILMLVQTVGYLYTIHKWAREHRAHHKYADTDADPYSAGRGLFFSHMGWSMLKKHPDAVEKGKLIDMRDIEADPIVMFQKRHYWWMVPVLCFVIPTMAHYYLLGDTFIVAVFIGCVFRLSLAAHSVCSINSLSHHFGSRPYDKNIMASNNTFVGIFAAGEGWHNYHHVFPWDYKNSELGDHHLNINCALIDFFAKIGWAYDLKTASDEIVIRRALRTGDGLPYKYSKLLNDKNPIYQKLLESINGNGSKVNTIWGWDDEEMDPHEKKFATIIHAGKLR